MTVRREAASAAGGCLAIALVTALYTQVLRVNATTVALTLLLVVVLIAAWSTRRVAIATSLVAFICFNFFFLPPVGTFTIAKPEDLVALFALLAVSLVASHLSTQARRRAQETIVLVEQRKEAELARKSAELKSALLASLSHDLKTPMTAVTIAANNLRAAWLTEEQRSDQVDLVISELARLRRLFENMIEMARIETKSVSAEPEWVDAAAIIEAAVTKVDAALAGRHVDVSDTTESLVIRVDPRLTSAALAHLIENAAQHSPAGTAITVRVLVEGSELRIGVRDRGTGLDGAILSRLGDRPSAEVLADPGRFGKGMGLAISRGLLGAQGGRLWAANDPAGGAVMTMSIPAEVRAAALEGDVA